jgi:hypothetical protein
LLGGFRVPPARKLTLNSLLQACGITLGGGFRELLLLPLEGEECSLEVAIAAKPVQGEGLPV